MRKRPIVFAALVALAGFAYFAAFTGYGVNFEDEGTLLYQIERTADGQVPYREFHIGYTPAIYYLHAAIMNTFGRSVMPGRWVLAAVNAFSMFLIVLLSLRLMAPRLAWLPAVFYMLAIPVHPGAFAAFNIPYPVWYNVLFFCAGVLSLLAFARSGNAVWAGLAGLLAGADFMFKPNAGLFQLAASSFAILSVVPMGPGSLIEVREKIAGIWWWALWTCTLVGTWGVFMGKIGPLEVYVLLLPVTVAALLCAWRCSVSVPTVEYPGIIKASLLLIGGFIVVNLPWMFIVHGQLGTQQFLIKVFFLGADFEKFYYIAYPLVGTAVLIGLLASVAAAVLPAMLRGGRVAPAALAAGGLVAGTLGIAFLARHALMPEGFSNAINSEFESAVFVLTLVAHWVFLLVAARSIGTSKDTAEVSACNVIFAVSTVFMYLQLYPRTDYMHWVTAAPLSIVLGIALVDAGVRRWSAGAGRFGRALVYTAWVAPLVFVLAVRAAPRIAAIAVDENLGFGRPPAVTLNAERAPVWMNAGRALRYNELAEVVGFLHDYTEPGDEVFTFPALDIVSFLSDRHNPTRHGYFYPRWPGHDAEAEVVASLMERAPLYAVVLHAHAPFFVSAPMYYYDLGQYLDTHYRPFVKIGRYQVLRHRGAVPAAHLAAEAAVEPAPMAVPVWLRDGLASTDPAVRKHTLARADVLMIEDAAAPVIDALADPDPAVRDRAVWTLQRASDPRVGDALVRAVADWRLSPREQVLATRLAGRVVGDAGLHDLFLLARDAGGKVRSEAIASVFYETLRRVAASFWPGARPAVGAGNAIGDNMLADDTELTRTIQRWIQNPYEDLRLRRAAIRATRELDTETVVSLLRDPNVFDEYGAQPYAAYELGRRNLPSLSIAQAFGFFGYYGDAYMEYLVPRLVRRVFDGSEESDRQLAEAALYSDKSIVRRQAGWLAATMGAEHTVKAAARNLYSGDADLRKSALWTLHRRGRSEYLGEVRRLLSDPDFGVREFAERAVRALELRALVQGEVPSQG